MIEPIDFQGIFQSLPGNYIILLPDAPKFTIVAFNETRAAETFTRKEDIGLGIFEAFPDNPDDPTANGVAMLTHSLQTVMRTKRTHQMAVQKYDIPTANDSGFEERYWLPKNIPVLNEQGEVAYIIHYVQDTTAQMLAEQREDVSRQNFEEFFNQANAPFAILTGEDFMFTYANPAYVELMGERQLVGKLVLDAIPELIGQPFFKQMQDVFNSGQSYYGIEVPATARFKGDAEPSTRYFNLTYTAFRDERGQIKGVIAYAYDVSEQVAMRKKEQLHQLNQQTYQLFMQAPMGICIFKGDDHVVELANMPMIQLWGKNPYVLGKPIREVLPEIEGQGFFELLTLVKNSGNPHIANEALAKLVRDGKLEDVYVNFVFQPYYEADNTISGVMAIAIEVTEQVLARKKIEYAEETARLAMESAEMGAYEVNLLTDEMTTSPRFNAIWGVNGTASRTSFAELLHPDDLEIRAKAHEESLITGKLYYETRVLRPDGNLVWVKINGTVLYDIDRRPARLLGIIQDITEQKAFTEEMTRLVKEKTRDLQAANDQLEVTNRELQQFAYITSHDLQEPLRKIQVFASMLAEKDGPSPPLNKISAAALRMRGLINDLLEYSQLSQSDSPFKPVNLNDSLHNVISDFELLITQKQATINADTLETIDAVSLQINQLFFNLIGNALKFAKADTAPVITITASKLNKEKKAQMRQLKPNKDYYEIVFADNGIGFEQDYADKIFTVFQRLNQRSHYDGYGIGLAICSKVVANHQGLISAEGETNKGAKFTVVLPYRQG